MTHSAGRFEFALVAAALAAAIAAQHCAATVVRFQTTSGNVDVRLLDKATPLSVQNFLNYSNANRYDDMFIHRVPQGGGGSANFLIQGGGFKLNNSIFAAAAIATNPAVPDEPGISNVRGTLAFAGSAGGSVNQWFFNVGNNTFLDQQALTAFGRVVGNGMTVVDAINNLSVINAATAQNAPGEDFDEVPVYNLDKVLNQGDILNEDAVIVQDVRVLNIPAGDYTFDGKVDGADLAVWKADFGSKTKGAADGNGDGQVNGADILIWQRTFGQNFGVPVPEPSAAALAAAGVGAILTRRRRRSSVAELFKKR